MIQTETGAARVIVNSLDDDLFVTHVSYVSSEHTNVRYQNKPFRKAGRKKNVSCYLMGLLGDCRFSRRCSLAPLEERLPSCHRKYPYTSMSNWRITASQSASGQYHTVFEYKRKEFEAASRWASLSPRKDYTSGIIRMQWQQTSTTTRAIKAVRRLCIHTTRLRIVDQF